MKEDKQGIGIYIHIPFCIKKCLYCDFVSGKYQDETVEAYFEILKKELSYRSCNEQRKVETIYFGGGTPSLPKGSKISETLTHIRNMFDVSENAEITLEMNPATADDEKLKIYKAAGINRLSIGLQSASDEELKRLGRVYGLMDFEKCYNAAKRTGFDNINIDIMSAVPGQSVKDYERTLDYVIGIRPEHISSYSLIIEENTPYYEMFGDKVYDRNVFEKYGIEMQELPSEDDERRMYMLTFEKLKEAGYNRYEISNYSLPGYESRHNSSYWMGSDYIGAGVSASSYINGYRITNINSVGKYISDFPDVEKEKIKLTQKDMIEEFMFLGLRMMKGISRKEFRKKFNMSIDTLYMNTLEKLRENGLINEDGDRIFLTGRGVDVSNIVLAEFLL